MIEWQNEPTENGFWLMHDVWRGYPEVVIVSGIGTLSPVVESPRSGRITGAGMLRNAKWSGPIRLFEEKS